MKRKTWDRIVAGVVVLLLMTSVVLSGCTGAIEDLEAKVTAVEQANQDLEAKVTALERGSQDLEAKVTALEEEKQDLEAKVTALEGEVVRIIYAEPWVKVTDDHEILLEGPSFDRDGNLYVSSVYTGEIFKITPDKEVTSFFKDEGVRSMASIDIHKDGRLFCCTFLDGGIIAVDPDGKGFTELLSRDTVEGLVAPDDLTFDSEGNFYFDDYAVSKIYRVSSDLKNVDLIKGPTPEHPNGISLVTNPLTGKETRLLIAEFEEGRIWQMDLNPEDPSKQQITSLGGARAVAEVAVWGCDSNAIDADGNLYQCIIGKGIVVVKANTYDIIAVIRFPGVESGEQVGVTNMAIKPGTDEAYVTVGLGPRGAEVYKFRALAKAPVYFSHR